MKKAVLLPKLFFADINMPLLYRILTKDTCKPTDKNIPAVFTAFGATNVVPVHTQGATAFIRKQADIEGLRNHIKKVINFFGIPIIA